MRSNQKILILSITVGAGHTRAAEAMREALLQKNPGNQVEILDIFCYANPLLGKVIIGTYMELIKMSPSIYQYLYTKAEVKGNSATKREFVRLLNKLTSSKLASFVEEFQPDVIVCTHPFPLGIISTLKEKLKLPMPIVAVITDFTIHPFWIFDNVDTYVIAVEELKKDLLKFGVQEERIIATGIPIDPKFAVKVDKTKVLRSFNLKAEVPTILVMGGGLGLGPLKKVVNALNETNLPFQLIVVVGKNKELQKNLTAMLPSFKIPTKVYGYIKNIYEFMEVSDLIITKPGGLTSSECLAKGLPMVIVSPIPGQEERNSDFLINSKVAIKAENEKVLPTLLKEILDDPKELGAMKERAFLIGQPRAAFKVADYIMEELIKVAKGGVVGDTY